MKMDIYFKCYKCGYIYNKNTMEFVKDPEVQKLKDDWLDDINIDCISCIEYESWERNEYEFALF